MVEALFRGLPPSPSHKLLDPGCGEGALVEGVLRWCRRQGCAPPQVVGVEADPNLWARATRRLADTPSVEVVHADYLTSLQGTFDYVLCNPPYVSVGQLELEEKARYRAAYAGATGRFDLYMLFMERARAQIAPGGRAVFLTPEKFLYVESARSLRRLLATLHVVRVALLPEDTFGKVRAYPTMTVLDNAAPGPTRIDLRDGTSREVALPGDGSSWIGSCGPGQATVLEDACLRVSCGVETAADSVFVRPTRALPPELRRFAHPTIAGRQLKAGQEPDPEDSILLPCDAEGALLASDKLGPLGDYLGSGGRREILSSRACARNRPWYSIHDAVPLRDILRPKILCRDLAPVPHFWADREGRIVPRHSVYYLTPLDPRDLDDLLTYLNGASATRWLEAHSQRASGGFLRLQSSLLRRLPLPARLARASLLSGVSSPPRDPLAQPHG